MLLGCFVCLWAAPSFAQPRVEHPSAALSTDATGTQAFEPPFKLSLPTVADKEAWQQAGFRLQLGYAYGHLMGVNGSPGGVTHAAVIRAGARLDEQWSLLSTLNYSGASQDMVGLRFLGTLDPTWHVTERFSIAVGAGFGGIVEGFADREDEEIELNDALVASYTHVGNDSLLPACVGVGAAALVRVAFDLVIGPTASYGWFFQGDGTYTKCEMSLGRVDPDTARPLVRRQYWGTYGANLGMMVTWR